MIELLSLDCTVDTPRSTSETVPYRANSGVRSQR
jgi:hypothetical protein